ncbi:MAG: HypC/HybG/HupF family hydrogenase formation chaperone [Chloroflexota bacterium]
MCLVLPARVLEVHGETAEVELHGGMLTTVSLAIRPDVTAGQYVMVDRGLVLEVIAPEEVEALLALYDEMGQMLTESDLAPEPARVQGDARA